MRRPPSLEGAFVFRLLNRQRALRSLADWNASEADKLWLYNLHYFDDLNAEGAGARRAWHRELIARWIAENPPGRGNGWEPYPLSLRIVNWIKWALAGNRLEGDWLHSLAVQARFLARRIEWHLLGNHLLANAKALVFAGTFFEGSEADAWGAKGLSILDREIDEQILPDGGHFERSPMYHAIILEDVLDLVNLARAFPMALPPESMARWAEITAPMRHWLAVMSHADGRIAFFNDAAFAVAGEPAELEDYAHRLGLGLGLGLRRPVADGVTQLCDSGYVRVQKGEMVALLDVAPIGPDYLPGHAHADTLSFELSLCGHRVLVNSGTSLYGTGPERQRQRGTAAHNTVEVNGEDSSEVWGGFRVARRARPFDFCITESEGTIIVRSAHDGYMRLPGRVVHRREWRFADRRLVVRDRLDGRFGQAVARYYLHPEIVVEGEERRGLLILPGKARPTISWEVDGGEVSLRQATWHPEFGLSVPNQCLEITLSGPQSTMTFAW